MRSINNETRQTMNSRRNFVNYATMTLSNGRILYLKPSDFRLSGQSFTDDWVDGDSFQIGTAIGKTATLLLDNTDGRVENTFEVQTVEPADWATNYTDYYTYSDGFYYPIREEVAPIWAVDTYYTLTDSKTYPHGKFSEYDFYMAYFSLYVCLPDAYHYGGELQDEMIPIGIFTVTTPTSHGATIEITGVDNMYMFDKDFSQCNLDFTLNPTLLEIINKCCEDCGVAIGYSQTFENYNLTVSERPENATYRQVVSWVAQTAGCNATITNTGALTLKSYDMSALMGIDGGSFTAIGEEFELCNFTWTGEYETFGRNVVCKEGEPITRSGKYKVTKINISDIADPSNFSADYRINKYASLNYGTDRYSKTLLTQGPLVAGDNVVDFEIELSTLNRTVYWIGVVGNNYGSPTASTFRYKVYMEPVSYADLDSADGGSFEPEYQCYDTIHWKYSGEATTTNYWNFYKNLFYTYIKPAGKYKITRTHIENIADPSHFNAEYIVQKSVDNGSTWTDEQSGSLVIGDNLINFDIDIPENIVTRYRVCYRQDVVTDPNASSFDATLYIKANDALYLDGDNFDGGNFSATLDFHNLTSINGTSICTDDVSFTGVEIKNGDNSVHYPDTLTWNNYAMVVDENPFTKGHESIIAKTIYDRISGLKFRPFTTSAIQDPTIEVGDPCVIYDVKGNMYNSIITNVVFHTGGMTELSCNAEPPARQASRYSNSSSYAIRKQMDYNSQVAHFNEIASAALGYYKTDEVDAQTGATITYLHNLADLANSDIVVKIANGIVAISDNYNTPQRSWNTGFDASTGTMLLNLIYVHGLTSDWIKTGQLTVGGVNNIDGIIHVVNEQLYSGPHTTDFPSHAGSTNWWWATRIGYTWLKPAGTYTITKVVIDNVSDPTAFTDFICNIQTSSDNGSTYTTVKTFDLVIGDNIIDYTCIITETDEMIYRVQIAKKSVALVTDPTFDYTVYTTGVNTVIDNKGVEIRKGEIKLNGKDTFTTNKYDGTYMGSDGIAFGSYYDSHSNFEVTKEGVMYARNGIIAGLKIDMGEKGWYYNASMGGDADRFFKISAWGGVTCGKEADSSDHGHGAYGWMRMDYITGWGLLRVDYAGHEWGGIVVTNVGNNDYTKNGDYYITLKNQKIIRYTNGTVKYTSWTSTDDASDKRLKIKIRDLSEEDVRAVYSTLEPIIYQYIESENIPGTHVGVYAQDMEKALETIGIEDSPIVYEDERGYKHLSYQETIGFQMAGIKHLYEKIDKQQKEIDELRQRLDKLEGK